MYHVIRTWKYLPYYLCGRNLLVTCGFYLQKACNMYLWCFFVVSNEQAVEQIVKLPVIWEAVMLMWCHFNDLQSSSLICVLSLCSALCYIEPLKRDTVFSIYTLIGLGYELNICWLLMAWWWLSTSPYAKQIEGWLCDITIINTWWLLMSRHLVGPRTFAAIGLFGLHEMVSVSSCQGAVEKWASLYWKILQEYLSVVVRLTHWGRVTHICVSKLTITSSHNGLSPERRQAITWPNAGVYLIESLGTNFSEILIGIHTFSFKKNSFENVICEMASIFVSASMC